MKSRLGVEVRGQERAHSLKGEGSLWGLGVTPRRFSMSALRTAVQGFDQGFPTGKAALVLQLP